MLKEDEMKKLQLVALVFITMILAAVIGFGFWVLRGAGFISPIVARIFSIVAGCVIGLIMTNRAIRISQK